MNNKHAAGLELGVWRNYVILRIFGTNSRRILPPFVSLTMEFPSGVHSELNGRSPASTGLMPIVRPLIVSNPILASINFVLRCCRCFACSAPAAAEQRVYGATEQRFVGASAPPKPKTAKTSTMATCNGDSPPYLPSNGLRSSYLASTELCDSSGSGSNDMNNGGAISEYARWEAGHQGHQGHQGHRGQNGHNGAVHQRQNSAVRDLAV